MRCKLIILAFILFLLYSPIQCDEKAEQNEKLLMRAVEFHGHLGPYLVLGVRAGLYANQVLGKDPMETEARIKTKISPPESCFVDGVQFSTGCTFGKRNIFLEEGKGLHVTFKKEDKMLSLVLKKEVIEEMNSLPDVEEAWEALAKDFYKRDIKKIFQITVPK